MVSKQDMNFLCEDTGHDVDNILIWGSIPIHVQRTLGSYQPYSRRHVGLPDRPRENHSILQSLRLLQSG